MDVSLSRLIQTYVDSKTIVTDLNTSHCNSSRQGDRSSRCGDDDGFHVHEH